VERAAVREARAAPPREAREVTHTHMDTAAERVGRDRREVTPREAREVTPTPMHTAAATTAAAREERAAVRAARVMATLHR
jgi:type VI protein secretion system component VasA